MSIFSRKPIHKGKVLQTERLIMQPFTVDLNDRQESIVSDLVIIFFKNEIIKYNPNRRISNVREGNAFLLSTMNDYDKESEFNYFLFRKDTHSLIGLIYLLPPKSVKKYYPAIASWPSVSDRIRDFWMIEFYLDPNYWGRGIMSLFVEEIIQELFTQGAKTVGALADEGNAASSALLKKLYFRKDVQYKDLQSQILWLRYKPFS